MMHCFIVSIIIVKKYNNKVNKVYEYNNYLAN